MLEFSRLLNDVHHEIALVNALVSKKHPCRSAGSLTEPSVLMSAQSIEAC